MNIVSLIHHHDFVIVSPPPYFHYLITITTITSHCYCVTTHTAITHLHSYCFTNTTTSTMSFRCRNKDALKNAMIEEGLLFMTLKLGLVEVLMLTCCVRCPFPRPWVKQLEQLCSGTCLSLLKCCFVLMVVQWNCPISRQTLEGRGKKTSFTTFQH